MVNEVDYFLLGVISLIFLFIVIVNTYFTIRTAGYCYKNEKNMSAKIKWMMIIFSTTWIGVVIYHLIRKPKINYFKIERKTEKVKTKISKKYLFYTILCLFGMIAMVIIVQLIDVNTFPLPLIYMCPLMLIIFLISVGLAIGMLYSVIKMFFNEEKS